MASRTKSSVPFPSEPNSKHRNARTMDAQTLKRIATDPAFSGRIGTPSDHSRSGPRGSWESDYGPGRNIPSQGSVDTKGLRPVSSRGGGHSGGGVRQSSLVPGRFAAFKSQVMSLCPGYRVFVLSCGIGAGVLVLRGMSVFY